MGEIRIVIPGKTRGYPYPVCKKKEYSNPTNRITTRDTNKSISPDKIAKNYIYFYLQKNFNGSNTDGSFTTACSNSFLSP